MHHWAQYVRHKDKSSNGFGLRFISFLSHITRSNSNSRLESVLQIVSLALVIWYANQRVVGERPNGFKLYVGNILARINNLNFKQSSIDASMYQNVQEEMTQGQTRAISVCVVYSRIWINAVKIKNMQLPRISRVHTRVHDDDAQPSKTYKHFVIHLCISHFKVCHIQ